MNLATILLAFGGLILGLIGGVAGLAVYRKVRDEQRKDSAEREAERIIQRAKSQAAKIEKDAKQKAKDFEQRARRNAEGEIKKQKQNLEQQIAQLKDKEAKIEKDAKRREESLANRARMLDEREEELEVIEKRTQRLEEETLEKTAELKARIERSAALTAEQATQELKTMLLDTAREQAASKFTQIEEQARKEAMNRAQMTLAVAVSRFASEVASEKTITSLPLSGEEMKGKIIGREGRNIRALEAACGVDLIVDETPETVIISCFDPIRREVCRRALERLMADGRVHPARIEEVVEKVKSELVGSFKDDGEKACFDLGLTGMQHDLQKLVGSMRYRQTESQNLYEHSLEVAYIAGMLAEEVGADATLARRAGLLHDIGKALPHTVEGSFAKAGADYARRHGEKPELCHAILAQKNETEPHTVLDHILQAANNFSESRPGANRGMIANFIKRLQDLESVANSFDGVLRSYAIQSGKEIRVLVDSGKVTDEQAVMLSRDVAKKIERELNYPGQVKVNVLREIRIVEHAR